MIRVAFVALALAACVAASNDFGPRTLEQAITGFSQLQTNTNSIDSSILNSEKFFTITQRLDNFNLQNNATFQQRYVSDGQYYRAGGPLYVVLGSLSSISLTELQRTLVFSLARSEHGHMFLLENRFYGDSIPTDDLSVENLQYLTVEQTLADAANFIQHIKSITPYAQNSPVIVAGRHYGGSLAVWLRQKYPHLTAGVWASSAPLLAQQNHQQYLANVADSLRKTAGDECYNLIDAGFAELSAIAVEGRLAELSERLNVCETGRLQTNNDISALFVLLADIFSSISSYPQTVGYFCGVLVSDVSGNGKATDAPSRTPGEAIAALLDYLYSGNCIFVDYDDFIRYDSQIEVNTTHAYYGSRQSKYQRCTQLGWFSTSESSGQPFGSLFPLSFFTDICESLFGADVAGHEIAQSNQDRFNVEHGGVNPWISNALFTYGELDHSRTLGVTRDLAESAVALQILESGISNDFYEISQFDQQHLIDAKLDIIAAIRSWSK